MSILVIVFAELGRAYTSRSMRVSLFTMGKNPRCAVLALRCAWPSFRLFYAQSLRFCTASEVCAVLACRCVEQRLDAVGVRRRRGALRRLGQHSCKSSPAIVPSAQLVLCSNST